jgi:hypothetical protein
MTSHTDIHLGQLILKDPQVQDDIRRLEELETSGTVGEDGWTYYYCGEPQDKPPPA